MNEYLIAPASVVHRVSRAVPEAKPVAVTSADRTIFGVVEMLLKDRGRLNTLLREARHQRQLVPRLLAVAVVGFAVYGVIMTALVNAVGAGGKLWLYYLPVTQWNGPSAANLTLAYTLGLIAANGICLPSFYFYGLLAGVKISMLGVSAHALKGMAAGAVALIGLLPIYAAIALTSLVFPLGDAWAAYVVSVGLALPFIAGFAGAANLYEGFVGLADTMTNPHCALRECFLRRLILAWVGCFTFVTPVVIFTLWRYLSALT